MDLRCMLAPQSIAIVGASADPATIRGRILEYLLQRDYPGALYLVSPSQSEIRGRKTYATLADIPGPVDLVLIAVRADATQQILEQCAAIGVKFAICYGSGFAESGEEGAVLQQALAQLALTGGPRLCGPNSAGFFNVKGAVPATFARNVDARRQPISIKREGPRNVAIVAQSGGLGFAMNDRCAVHHGLLVSFVVSTGNEVDLEAMDFAGVAVDDPDVRVVLLLVEAIKDGSRLPALADKALSAGKPIVVAKFGRTDAGSRAVSSHAARLTGSDAAYDAAFRRHGLIRVDDEDAMVDLAAVFSACPLPAGRRVGILTTSGGAGVWMADACESGGLVVPLLDAATQSALEPYVPSFGAIQNPVDMTAQISVNPVGGAAQLSPLVGSLQALHDSPSLDAIILIANMSDGDVLARERDALSAFVGRLQKPLFLYSHAPPSVANLDLVQELGLVCLGSTRRVAEAIARMADYAEARAKYVPARAVPSSPIPEQDRCLLAGGLCEYDAKALLGRHGIAISEERLVQSADEAVAVAKAFGQPVALKIQSRHIPHKTEIGGIILGLSDPDQVHAAYGTLLERAGTAVPDAAINGVLVQKMQAPGRELAIGIVEDPAFGPMMMVGMGGIYIEVMKDVALEPLPVRREQALAMLQRLRAWPLLQGARGKPPADVEAVATMMEQLSRMVEGAGGACREIDLNPVFVYDEGDGAVVVDAIVVGRDEAIVGGPH
ncbi:MAG: CoA-binding domain protein [Bradyrhizobium sp.]|nr:CoA-binding domain protein [Bradyrhizobium sp.]